MESLLFMAANMSVKATVTNQKGSVEKLYPKESPEDAHTVLRGKATKDSMIHTTLRICHSCSGYQNHEVQLTQS